MDAEAASRTAQLIGVEGVERLARARVLVVGVGGVGGYAVEALARSGVGHLTLVDPDVVAKSNLNRQIVALVSTVGQLKVEVMRARVLDINPVAEVQALPLFYGVDTAEQLKLETFDYVIDAIDTVASKVALIVAAQQARVPIVSAMGAGNKLDATRFCVTDLFRTEQCPLARVMRKRLRQQGITHLDVVFSSEPPGRTLAEEYEADGANPDRGVGGQRVPGSIAFVPSVAGLILAGHVVQRLLGRS